MMRIGPVGESASTPLVYFSIDIPRPAARRLSVGSDSSSLASGASVSSSTTVEAVVVSSSAGGTEVVEAGTSTTVEAVVVSSSAGGTEVVEAGTSTTVEVVVVDCGRFRRCSYRGVFIAVGVAGDDDKSRDHQEC
jgi:hypothetical protein